MWVGSYGEHDQTRRDKEWRLEFVRKKELSREEQGGQTIGNMKSLMMLWWLKTLAD
jgi:hypothetical protein